jgi:hypothetical protein
LVSSLTPIRSLLSFVVAITVAVPYFAQTA